MKTKPPNKIKNKSPKIKDVSVDDLDRVLQHNFPMTFDWWMRLPFMSYLTTWSVLTEKFDHSARFFELNEREMQRLALASKKKLGGKKLRRTSRRSDQKALIERVRRDEKFSEVFRRCQEGDDMMMAALGNQMVRHCEHLFLLAEGRNGLAVKYLAELAIKSTKGLESVADNHYEDLQGLAAIEYAWPVMTSPVKTLSSASPDWAKLGLGATLNLDLNNKRRVRLNTPVGRLAWQLLNYVANLRQCCTASGWPSGGAKVSISFIEQEVAGLQKLTNDSQNIDKWWRVAESCLVASFPSAGDKTKLDEKNTVFDGFVAQRDRRTPDRHRGRIIEKLREEFYSIAGFRLRKIS